MQRGVQHHDGKRHHVGCVFRLDDSVLVEPIVLQSKHLRERRRRGSGTRSEGGGGRREGGREEVGGERRR